MLIEHISSDTIYVCTYCVIRIIQVVNFADVSNFDDSRIDRNKLALYQLS